MYLVVVDTAQIQPYVFGSNRLRENIGASHLVAETTGAWALEVVQTVAPRSNVTTDLTLDDGKRIEDVSAALDAEVLYSGGGNVVVAFQDGDRARQFTRQLSRRALERAPGLRLIIASSEFEWGQSLTMAVQGAFTAIANQKQSRVLSSPLLGLGVTAMCRSTGLPAVGLTPKIGNDPTSEYLASAEILAKIAVAVPQGGRRSEADSRLHQMVSPPGGFDYPGDFDNLGRTLGEQSYIAVIHADGDGIGRRIQHIGEQHHNPGENRDYIAALRAFSNAVGQAAQAALKAMLVKLVARIDAQTGEIVHTNAIGKVLARITLKQDSGKWLLPFRPIVFGGDDLTFVADGRLGLSLATEYLRDFEQQTASHPECGGKITACAGIATVKVHYPFARAYALAEDLAGSAKVYRRSLSMEGSCLDWHFALSGLSGAIQEIRRREYTTTSGSLTVRPVSLGPNLHEPPRTWAVVRKGIDAFQGRGWAGRHNKVKALRDAIREGPQRVERFLTRFNESEELPVVEPSMTSWSKEGWQGGYCGYFDAIELADRFIPLQGGPTP